VALFVAALAGCGGGDGTDGVDGVDGVDGADGADGITPGLVYNVPAMTATDWANLTLTGTVDNVTVASPPVVQFSVKGPNNKAVVGLTTAQVAFTIAKLVPASNGEPSHWVNYIVATPSSLTDPLCPGTLGKPTNDSTGTLVDHNDGTYTYTFARNVAGDANTPGSIQCVIDKSTASNKGDLGDVSWQPNLTHRLAVQIQGYNDPTAADHLRLNSAINLFYDFVPATGAKVAADDAGNRELVAIDNCNQCHQRLAFHGGGSRVDTQYCVLCHTDQRKFGVANSTIDYATSTLYGPNGEIYDPATYDALTSTQKTAIRTDRVNDKSWTDFPTMVHKIHNGPHSMLTGNNIHGLNLEEITFPRSQTNCVACHNNAAQADNWKTNPSRKACGACHDGIDWATGAGVTLSGSTFGHEGGGFADDSDCTLCHRPGGLRDNTLAHAFTQTDYVLNGAVPTGVYNFTYDVSAFTYGAGTASITFAIKRDGTNISLGEYNATTKPYLYMEDATHYATSYIEGTRSRGPQVVVAYSATKDGIATPADYTANLSMSLEGTSGIWQNPTTHPNATTWTKTSGVNTWTMIQNGDNSYTMTVAAAALPATPGLATGLIYGTFNQVGFQRWGDPVTPLLIAPQTAKRSLTTAERRIIVSADKCNACHGQLGASPNFHGGVRNDPQTCGICHNVDLTAHHSDPGYVLDELHPTQSIDSTVFIHRLHSGKTIFGEDTGFEISYPQSTANCARCHEGDAVTTTTSKRLFRRTSHPTATTWTVSSPTAAACTSCHDTEVAAGHIASASGVVGNVEVDQAGITALTAVTREGCMTCHGPGRSSDINVWHNGAL